MLLMFLKRKFFSEDATEEEIRTLFDVGAETGAIAESEAEMINNIFDFDDKSVSEISTHRKDIVAIPIDANIEEILSVLKNVRFSRIPVFDDDIDNILGILHIKDIVRFVAANGSIESICLKDIIRVPFFVPVSKKTDELFSEMSKKKVHMAVIIDEYGGTFGIVTMEDLIEEIMGSILDEYDDEEALEIFKQDDSTFIINGLTDLQVVSNFFNVKLPTDNYETLSGFIVSQLGHIPVDGEKPELEFGGLLFKVNQTEENRVASVTVCKLS